MRSVPLPFLSKITLLWTRAREPGPVSPVKVDSPLPFPWTQRGEIYKARVAAVMERVRARGQLRKQRRMAGVLILAALAAGFALGAATYHWKEVD